MTDCTCSVCERNRSFQKHLQNVAPESQDYFLALYDTLLEIEMDRDCYKVIVDGTWPHADEVIKHVRARKAKSDIDSPTNTN